MGTRRRGKRIRTGLNREPGMYVYEKDLLHDDAVESCSMAAFGLWVKMLLGPMRRSEPKGVLPGDPHDIARLFKCVTELQAKAWVVDNDPLLRELEQHDVFSRGKDMPGILAPDAIVNRRMYREWLELQDENARRSKGGKTRVKQAQRDAGGRFLSRGCPADGPAKHPADGPAKRPATHPATHPADGPAATTSEHVDTVGVTNMHASSKSSRSVQLETRLSLTPTPTLNRSRDHIYRDQSTPLTRDPDGAQEDGIRPVGVGVARLMSAMQRGPDLTAITDDLIRVTEDTNWRADGWQVKLATISRTTTGRRDLSDLVDRLEKDVDPVKAAGRGNQVIRDAKGFAIWKVGALYKCAMGNAQCETAGDE